MPTRSGVAVLGTGLLGGKVAERLATHGGAGPVTVWNRTESKARALEACGCAVAGSASAALAGAEVAVLFLADYAAAESVVLAAPDDAVRGLHVLQMGTIGVSESTMLCEALKERGAASYCEAPVQGSKGEALKGELLVMLGADEPPAEGSAVGGVLRCLAGGRVTHCGPVGAGAAAKLATNQLLAAIQVGFSTSLGMVEAAGVPVERWMEVVRPSALYCKQLDKKLPAMLAREFGNPNFPTAHMLKDVRLAEGAAEAAGLHTAAVGGLRGALEKACEDAGLRDADYSAVYAGVAGKRKRDQSQ